MRLFDRFPAKYLAPNAITCTGIVLGLLSIRTSLSAHELGPLVGSAWLILYAVLLDKTDGAVARRLGASSEFGVQLDSFSDFVTFGLAPAALLTQALSVAAPGFADGPAHAALLAVGALYAVAAAVRLAKFNVTTASIGKDFFLGLPSTSSGGLLAAGFLAHRANDLPVATLPLFAGALALNAALMLCNLPMPKIQAPAVAWRRVGRGALLVSAYVLIPIRRGATYLVTLASVATVGGFIYGLAVTRGRPPASADH